MKVSNDEKLDIGKRVYAIRTELSLNQETFGKAAGEISKQAINQWEKGRTCPDWHSLEKLKENLYINPRWVMLGIGEPQMPPEIVQLMSVLENPDVDLNDLLKYAQFRSQSDQQ